MSVDLFCRASDQFPSHFASGIPSALQPQQSFGWNNAFKGSYFSQQWANMVQVNMQTGSRDAIKGASRRMKQIITAVGDHTRRLWLAWNSALHTKGDKQLY